MDMSLSGSCCYFTRTNFEGGRLSCSINS